MLNRQLKWIVIIVTAGLTVSVVSYVFELSRVCTVRQLGIAEDIMHYDKTKDPQLCDMLNSKISQFNDACKSNIEELDCG
ncbi:conserved exported protein of unknown function [Candidatus Nitrosotalea okcheonensis]|uniref:Uncharacterized protein n=1 Tax=Candidatus Nitrosotalea okcheonensis TaxID=1903276 RepID=A0A2H1FCZ7_9ARCH|nr:conserved exported protein of unknown function [Candidatus Nitrosotalea okcheonensis]